MHKFLRIFFQLTLPVFIAFAVVGCMKDHPLSPENDTPEGYQIDYPWPSLASSPWPMNHHDPQGTGRSKFSGASSGLVGWVIDNLITSGGVVIGTDSSVYAISSGLQNQLLAIKSSGSVKWKFNNDGKISESYSTPLVTSDGTIYLTQPMEKSILAINPDGTLKWKYNTAGSVFMSGMNIGPDHTLYFIDNTGKLYALSPEGYLNWSYVNPEFFSGQGSAITFSNDGRTIYIPGKNLALFAFNVISREIAWSFNKGITRSGFSVDNNNNIYFLQTPEDMPSGKSSFFCIMEDGREAWHYDFYYRADVPDIRHMDAAIDKLGNVYFAVDTLYSFDFKGNLRWKLKLDGINSSPLICDAAGNVYLTTIRENFRLAVNSNGEVIWKVPFNTAGNSYFSSAVGYGSIIYSVSDGINSKLYTLR